MRKPNLYILMAALVSAGLSSCQKKFDPATYAPALDINGYTAASQVAKENLVAYWAFDGGLVDSVSNTSGTATGTTFATGIKRDAMQGALNSYVITAPSSDVTNLKSFTLTEWINTPPPSVGIIPIFSLANKTGFWGNIEFFFENGSTNDNGLLRFHLFNGTDDKALEVNGVKNLFNKFVNIAFSYDATTSNCKIYVNGSRIFSGAFPGVTGPLNFKDQGNIVFGAPQFMTTPSQTSSHGAEGWASFMPGKLDEVRIYNKALSDIEVGSIAKLEGRGK
ncbi:LamG domain-containing protein [Mucilaginibacter rigui]|uniref:LamG domain-containing protein n=1 Tax=Mucilaginibacter rigui TaxID=534635 RepID=A0ABR7X524_9SPHI|nr:LamG domain-containing protein [Mucilaginibacter rigui]MBD1385677.1 LamG domain-containing protein [Mucilaginibacter rigui]